MIILVLMHIIGSSADNVSMKNNFIKCGIIGWCMEVIWTGTISLINKDKRMMGNTSMLMFPIYGMVAFLKPICKFVNKRNMFIRGGIYTCFIFIGEYVSGTILKKRNMCPWDYSKSKYHINGLIRLDYFPAWFGAGLLFERILTKDLNSSKKF